MGRQLLVLILVGREKVIYWIEFLVKGLTCEETQKVARPTLSQKQEHLVWKLGKNNFKERILDIRSVKRYLLLSRRWRPFLWALRKIGLLFGPLPTRSPLSSQLSFPLPLKIPLRSMGQPLIGHGSLCPLHIKYPTDIHTSGLHPRSSKFFLETEFVWWTLTDCNVPKQTVIDIYGLKHTVNRHAAWYSTFRSENFIFSGS